MKNNLVPIVVVALVVGAAAFFGGMKYDQTRPSAQASLAKHFGGARSGRVGAMMNRPVQGSIIAQDDKSITVKMSDGSTKIVLLTDTTSYSQTSKAVKTDLKVATTVGVFGKDNSDGSVTAQNVQINPQFRNQTNNSGGPSMMQ